MAKFKGKVCYVGQDHEAADGRQLVGGWHYAVVEDTEGKQLALTHAKADVALWEKRAGRRGVGKFAAARLEQARQNLADVESSSWDMPDADHKLVVDPDSGDYRDATKDDASHRELHHQRLVIIAPYGGIGEPTDAESIAATHRHLDELERRLGERGLDDHERDHILTTPAQVAGARRWLSTQGGE